MVRGQTFQCAPLTWMYGMRCQYSRWGQVSSKKHKTPSEGGVEGRGGHTPWVAIAAEVLGSYSPLLVPPEVVSRAAKVAKTLKSRTPAKLYVYETLLERLAQDLRDMAAARGLCIQEAHAMVGQRHVARHWHVPPADEPNIREGLVGRATRARRDPRRAVASEAGDAVDTRGLNGLREGHRRQDGGEAACEHRLARPWGAEQEQIMVRTPAFVSPRLEHPG